MGVTVIPVTDAQSITDGINKPVGQTNPSNDPAYPANRTVTTSSCLLVEYVLVDGKMQYVNGVPQVALDATGQRKIGPLIATWDPNALGAGVGAWVATGEGGGGTPFVSACLLPIAE